MNSNFEAIVQPERWAEAAALIYNAIDGSLTIDSTGENGGWMTTYSIDTNLAFDLDAFQPTGISYSEARSDHIGEIVFGGIPEGRYNLGSILPSGLTETEVANAISEARFIGLGGQGSVGTFDLSNGTDLVVQFAAIPELFEFCDFDANGFCEVADADILTNAIASESSDLRYDLDEDGHVSSADIARFRSAVTNLYGVEIRSGDLNMNGRVDAQDLNSLALNFQSEVTLYSAGDTDGDGFVDSVDLNEIGRNWKFDAYAANGNLNEAVPVPEPGFRFWTIVGLAMLFQFRRKNPNCEA